MKRNKKIAIIVLFFATIITYSQDYNFSIAEIPKELTENANSVVLFDYNTVDIHSQKFMTVKEKRAVTVLNKMGDEGNKYVVVPFDKNTKVKKIKTIIYNAFGKEIKKVKSKEYNDVSRFDGISLYNDSRMLYYRHVPTGYPYTIYYEIEYESINTGFVPKWYPITSYYTSVKSSKYTLNSKQGLKVRFKEKNFNGFTISKKTSDHSLEYELKDHKAIEKESYSPDLFNITPNLLVGLYKFSLEGVQGEATNWKEFGKWKYDKLRAGNDQISEPVKMQMNRLVEGVTDPIEKAKIIYEYVQNKTRYISVQVGIGGWKPIAAEEVHSMGYGDCKGLTNYTKTLLDAVGVKSHYTVLYAGEDKKDVEKDFFSMQGNHVILNLPTDEGDLWLECTSQKVPFGYLGDFTDDRDVLVITPEGGQIKHTKIYKIEENLQKTTGSYSIDNKGHITASVHLESFGTQYIDNLHRYDGESDKDLDISFKKYFSNINNIKFSEMKVYNNRKENKYEENLEFKASDYATISGQQMLIPINAFNKFSSVPKRFRNRKLQLELSKGFVDIDKVEINLPANYTVEFVPSEIKISTKFGSYEISLTKMDDDTYLYHRKFQIEEGKHPKEEYENYRSFIKKVRKYDNSKIILNKL